MRSFLLALLCLTQFVAASEATDIALYRMREPERPSTTVPDAD